MKKILYGFCILVVFGLVWSALGGKGSADNNASTANAKSTSNANDPQAELEAKCNANDGEACGKIGKIYDDLGRQSRVRHSAESKGVSSGPTDDFVKARQYYEKGCELGNGFACGELGWLYDRGFGVRHDYKQMLKYYKKGCDLKYGLYCYYLGAYYSMGEGVAKNLSTAKSYYGKGCDYGNSSGCEGYKELNEKGVK